MIRKLIFLLIAFFLILPFVNAESGSITITNTTNYEYIYFNGGASGGGFLPIWTRVYIDNLSFNHISNFRLSVSGGAFTFTHSFEQTNFVCSENLVVCNGIVWYDANQSSVYYVFLNDPVLVNNTLNLTFSNPYFVSNITAPAGNLGEDGAPTSSQPVTIGYGDPTHKYYGSSIKYSNVVVLAQTTDTYDVSYFQTPLHTQYFTINVSKGKSVNDRWTISTINNVSMYTKENSFNKVDFTFSAIYSQGIEFNVSIQTGDYTVAQINTTGTPVSNTTNQGTGGSSSGQIYFDYSTRSLNFPWGINVSLLAANWSNTFSPSLRIRAKDPTNDTIAGFPIDFSLQYYNTSRLWTFQETGTYNASLYSCGFFDVICNGARLSGLSDGNLIDTASLTVTQFQYNYSVSTDANSYSTGDTIRFTIINPSPKTTYFNVFSQVGGQNQIIDKLIQANSTTFVNLTVTGDMLFGSWEGALYTNTGGQGKAATKVFSIGNPTPGTRVSIRWDVNNLIGQTNNLYFTTNGNTSTVTVYKPILGTNMSGLADTFTANPADSQKSYLMDTVGTWNATIKDNGNASNTSYANITVLASLENLGCNKNLPNYVCWNNATYFTGDAFVINYKDSQWSIFTPFSHFPGTLNIYDPNGNLVYTKFICAASDACITPQSGSTSGLFNTTAIPGKYHAVIVHGGTSANSYKDGTIITDSYAVVSVQPFPVPTSRPPETITNIFDGWVSLLGFGVSPLSKFFFAWLITTIFIIGGFAMTNGNLLGGTILGGGSWGLFMALGYLPFWFAVIVTLQIALAMKWFR